MEDLGIEFKENWLFCMNTKASLIEFPHYFFCSKDSFDMLVKYDVDIMHKLEAVNWIVGDTMQINLPDLVKKEIKCLGSIKCEKEEIERELFFLVMREKFNLKKEESIKYLEGYFMGGMPDLKSPKRIGKIIEEIFN
jgi:hypothetical protein